MVGQPRISRPHPRRQALDRGRLSHKVFPVVGALLKVGRGLLVGVGGLHNVLRMFTDLVDVANVLGEARWKLF